MTSRIKNNQTKGILISNGIKSKETNNFKDEVRLGLTFKFLLLHDNEIDGLLSSEPINTAKKDLTYHPFKQCQGLASELKDRNLWKRTNKGLQIKYMRVLSRQWKLVTNVLLYQLFYYIYLSLTIGNGLVWLNFN